MPTTEITTETTKRMVASLGFDEHEKNLQKILFDFVGIGLIADAEAKAIISDIANKLAKDLRKEDENMYAKLGAFISEEIQRQTEVLRASIQTLSQPTK
jgi:polyhydroxyalkanoate synthesis regulator phasin